MAEMEQALREIDGDCQTPIGMLSVIHIHGNGKIIMVARNFETDEDSRASQWSHNENIQAIGSQAGRALL